MLSKDELNKLSSNVIKARIMKRAGLADLEARYAYELDRFEDADVDIVVSKPKQERESKHPQNMEAMKATHDKTGDKDVSLDQMVRNEKLANVRTIDKDIANNIVSNGAFKNDLEYMDRSTEHATKKSKTYDKSRYGGDVKGSIQLN